MDKEWTVEKNPYGVDMSKPVYIVNNYQENMCVCWRKSDADKIAKALNALTRKYLSI